MSTLNKKIAENPNFLLSEKDDFEMLKKANIVENMKHNLEMMFTELYSKSVELQILKTHFKLTPKQYSEIINKHREKSKC